MPAATFAHSVGILLTADRTAPLADLYSFKLTPTRVQKVLGWGEAGTVPLPARNPPNGAVTLVYVPPVPLTDEQQTALHGFIAEHRARYTECGVWVADSLTAACPDIERWVSGGAMPGRSGDGWDVDESPDHAAEEAAA